jgi:pyruvate formate lyase activating enzyme
MQNDLIARTTTNLQRLVETFPSLPIHVRTPVIPDFNDTPEDIETISKFISGHPNVDYELLPYHRLGTQKYVFLDREAPMGDVTLSNELFNQLLEVAKTHFKGRLENSKQNGSDQ